MTKRNVNMMNKVNWEKVMEKVKEKQQAKKEESGNKLYPYEHKMKNENSDEVKLPNIIATNSKLEDENNEEDSKMEPVVYDVNGHLLTMDEIMILVEDYEDKTGLLKDKFKHTHDLFMYSCKLIYAERDTKEISEDILEFRLWGKGVGNEYLGDGELKALYKKSTGEIIDLIVTYRFGEDVRLCQDLTGKVGLIDNNDNIIEMIRDGEVEEVEKIKDEMEEAAKEETKLNMDDFYDKDKIEMHNIKKRITEIKNKISDDMTDVNKKKLLEELEEMTAKLVGMETDNLEEIAKEEVRLVIEDEVDEKILEACKANRLEHGLTYELRFENAFDLLSFNNHDRHLGTWKKEVIDDEKVKFVFRGTLLNLYFSFSKIEALCKNTEDLELLSLTFFDQFDREVSTIHNDENDTRVHGMTPSGEIDLSTLDAIDYENDIEYNIDPCEVYGEKSECEEWNEPFNPVPNQEMTQEEVDARLQEIIGEIEEEENRLRVNIYVGEKVQTLVDKENINIIDFSLFNAYLLMNIGLEPVSTFITTDMEDVGDVIITFKGDGIGSQNYEMSIRELLEEGLAHWVSFEDENSYILNPLEYRGLMNICHM